MNGVGINVLSNKCVPVKATLPPAPERLLKVIRCGCKSSCDTKRCVCRKHGLVCTTACSDCKGVSKEDLCEDSDFVEV